MNQPIKVIWKYKNNNRRTQYAQYIFIGETSSNLMKILNKIANLNFYDTLINLSKDEYKPVNKTSSNITKYSDYQREEIDDHKKESMKENYRRRKQGPFNGDNNGNAENIQCATQ